MCENRNYEILKTNPQINVDPQCVGYESLAWFLSVSGYLQNDNSRSFADILASGGGGRGTAACLVAA